jgi:hypothetical protein
MTVHYFDSLADYDITKDGKEREDGRKRGLSIDDQKRDVVDFEAVCEISHTGTPGVGMSDDNDLVASIDEFLKLVRTLQNDGRRLFMVVHLKADTCGFPLPLLDVRNISVASKFVPHTGLRVEIIADHAMRYELD